MRAGLTYYEANEMYGIAGGILFADWGRVHAALDLDGQAQLLALLGLVSSHAGVLATPLPLDPCRTRRTNDGWTTMPSSAKR